MKKIIIIGSRKRDAAEDFIKAWKEFGWNYRDGDIIVSGGCEKGGDWFAEVFAQRVGATKDNGKLIIHLPKKPEDPNDKYAWHQAFYARNYLVAEEGEEDTVVIALVAPDKPGGTENTLKRIREIGIVKEENIKEI